jgi:hypothetical protein
MEPITFKYGNSEKKISQYLVIVPHLFHKSPLHESHWIFCGSQVAKIHQKGKTMIIIPLLCIILIQYML